MLAASRTFGETIAVIMVCGNLAIVPGSLLDACYPIPALIANNYDIIGAGPSQMTELRRNIGLVPQRPCPLPMSIYDNIAYGCRIHGVRGKNKLDIVVKHYLEAVGLWEEVKDRLNTPASKLSGGQQQRLCLARSLAVEPSYLLADESTSALDPIADYVIFMYLGEVIEQGDAKDIFNHPRHELTKRYLSGSIS